MSLKMSSNLVEPADYRTAVPLSARQRLIWMENQLAPTLPVNNEVFYLSVRGPLNITALQEAFRRLCLRHDALRARLSDAGWATDTLPYLEFAAEPGTALAHRMIEPGTLRTHLAALSRTPFKAGEILLRAEVMSEPNSEHHIVFVQSHLVTDGFSFSLLFQDLERFYGAVLAGNSAPAPAYHFRDHLSALASVDSTDSGAAAFWKKRLRDVPPRIRFYGQSAQSAWGRIIRTVRPISDALGTALLARTTGFSPSEVLACVTAVAVYRVTNDTSVALGVPFFNRSRDTMDVAGLFMEVVPNRFELSAEQSFADVARALHDYAAEVRPHRRHTVSTFESGHSITLNYYLPAPNSFAGYPARTTFTTALEVLDDAKTVVAPSDAGGGLMIRTLTTPVGKPYEIAFDFDSERWPDRALHERFADHFMAVLKAFDANPNQAIGGVEILSEAERAEALALPEGWHPFPQGLPGVVDMVRNAAALHPAQPAVVFEDRVLCYRNLMDCVDQVAAALIRRGVTTGSLVTICMGRSADLVIALLAVLRAGGAYVPLDPMHPTARLSMIIEDAAPLLLVTDGSFDSEAVIDAERVVHFAELARTDPATPVPDFPAPGPLAYVIFTSGSTGRPKGVRVRHHGLSSFLMAMREVPGLEDRDRLLSVTTVAFDIAALEFFLPLVSGATVHIAPYEATLDGAELARRMTATGITVLQATPATYRLLLGAGWRGQRVKALCGGEALSDDLAQRLIEVCGEIWNMYGPTETTIWSSIERISTETLPVTIGRPIHGTRFSVRTALGALCPPGTPGELNIGGDGVSEGYHHLQDLTAEKFVPDDVGLTPDARRYRTGDAVRQLPDGRIRYIGRIDFQVKVRGFRIELGEIEAKIGQVPGVESAAVIPFKDPSGETALAGYFSGDGSDETLQAIKTRLAEDLPAYMRVAILTHLTEVPLTPNGKIDRKALPVPDLSATTPSVTEPFADEIQRSVASVWEQVLGCKGIGPSANFFDLGGHSILALTLISEIERATGVRLELGTVWVAPTVRAMAERIRTNALSVPSATVILQEQGARPPLFCLCGLEIYRPFALALGKERPVYGLYAEEEADFLLQAASGKVADVSISSLAQAYATAIQRRQPDGPIQLAGVSFGGVLALETARLLEAAGRVVAGVILIDTIRHDGKHTDWIAYAAAKLRKLVTVGPFRMLTNLGRQLGQKLRDKNAHYVTASGGDAQSPARLREIAFIKAMFAHNASLGVTAPVTLVKASDRSRWGDGIIFDDDYGWGKALGKKVHVFEVPGDHLGILRGPAVDAIAQTLRGELL